MIPARALMPFVLAVASFAAPASAQDATPIDLGVTAGTLGVGPQASIRLGRMVGVRANATFLSIAHGFDSDDIDYRGRVKLRSAGAMIDLFPFGGNFYVSGGARYNGNKGRVRATPRSDTRIGDMTFTPAQIGTIDGNIDVRDVAPQATIGYGGRIAGGFSLGIEAGAMFQGAVRIRQFTASGALGSDARFRAELDRERASLQDDANDYKVYPILQLAAAYRF